MLDDASKIAAIDKSNALKVAAEQFKQLTFSDFSLDTQTKQYKNIVLTGMGGSALAGLVVRNWWESSLKLPFVVTRNYSLPAFVDANTLVIVSSYSGNTEEALAAAADAAQKGADMLVITSGGKLAEQAAADKSPIAKIPGGLQPRMAVFYTVRILAELFEKLGLLKGAVKELEAASAILETEAQKLVASVSQEQNQAKQIASKIAGKTAIIYSGPALSAASYKWKISLNETSKNLAWNNEFSELNHNEFMGWSREQDIQKIALIELKSGFDHPQIQKRFDITNKLLSGKIPKPITISAQGKTHIEQLLWTIQLGDFTSIYLAILNDIDPTPVDLVEHLKQELS